LIFDFEGDIYTKNGVNFDKIIHLKSIGLIEVETVAGYIRAPFPKQVTFYYFGRPIHIELPLDSGNKIEVGKILLTQIGRELSEVASI
jgi:hypothetical protein